MLCVYTPRAQYLKLKISLLDNPQWSVIPRGRLLEVLALYLDNLIIMKIHIVTYYTVSGT